MTYQPIHGVIVPTVTPFDDNGKLQPDVMPILADYLISKGVSGLFPIGSTGEGILLTDDERKTLAEASVRAVDGRVPVIIHTGAITTDETIALTRHARTIGADAVAVVPPYYFTYSDAALEAHYDAICEAVPDMPLYLYNFPARTTNVLSRELVIRLAKRHENIVGLKDSSGDLQTLFATNRLKEGTFNTAVGPDELIVAGLSMGLDASVSGHANLVPEIVVGIYQAVARGDMEDAQKLQRTLNMVSDVLSGGGWLGLLKGLLVKRGIPVGGLRRPGLSASPEAIQTALQQLTALRVTLEPYA